MAVVGVKKSGSKNGISYNISGTILNIFHTNHSGVTNMVFCRDIISGNLLTDTIKIHVLDPKDKKFIAQIISANMSLMNNPDISQSR